MMNPHHLMYAVERFATLREAMAAGLNHGFLDFDEAHEHEPMAWRLMGDVVEVKPLEGKLWVVAEQGLVDAAPGGVVVGMNRSWDLRLRALPAREWLRKKEGPAVAAA